MLMRPHADPDACASLRQDAGWVADVCQHFEERLGLHGPGVPFANDSAVVARFGDVVLKLFFPHQLQNAQQEAQLLQRLDGVLPIRTPRLLGRGGEAGWPYLLVSTLPGRDLSEAWPDLDADARLDVAGQVGEVLAALHRQPLVGELALNWGLWSRVQVAGAIDVHRRSGCPPALLQQLPGYLDHADLTAGSRGLGMLHGDVRPAHFKVARQAGRWRLEGLVDFSLAVVAPVDYEFAALGVGFPRSPGLLAAVLEGYGIDPREPGLSQRLFALALLHRVADLGAWVRASDPGIGSLDELAEHWFELE